MGGHDKKSIELVEVRDNGGSRNKEEWLNLRYI